jgi:4a-hydroxytetrahydrobiopterin dehydratase
VTWGKLWVKLKTHSAGGLTDKDFELARKIEEVVLWRPNSAALGTGHPKKFVHSKSE